MKTFYGNLGFTHFNNLGRAGKLLIQASFKGRFNVSLPQS